MLAVGPPTYPAPMQQIRRIGFKKAEGGEVVVVVMDGCGGEGGSAKVEVDDCDVEGDAMLLWLV